MAIAQRVSTLREAGELASATGELSFPLRDFLDGFYARPKAESLAGEPPQLAKTMADGARFDAYLGAVAEHLSRMQRWPVPTWTRKPERYLAEPWFGMKSHGGRMILLAESPPAFRVRNLFVSSNALSRV